MHTFQSCTEFYSATYYLLCIMFRTTCEMAYQMLLKWREGGEGGKGTRMRLIEVLTKHECESNAEFLRVGEQDHYWK